MTSTPVFFCKKVNLNKEKSKLDTVIMLVVRSVQFAH